MAEFRQLGLEQRMVTGIVHEAEVVFKFRIKSDGQYVFLE